MPARTSHSAPARTTLVFDSDLFLRPIRCSDVPVQCYCKAAVTWPSVEKRTIIAQCGGLRDNFKLLKRCSHRFFLLLSPRSPKGARAPRLSTSPAARPVMSATPAAVADRTLDRGVARVAIELVPKEVRPDAAVPTVTAMNEPTTTNAVKMKKYGLMKQAK